MYKFLTQVSGTSFVSMCSQHKAATDQLLCIGRPVPLTSMLISQYRLLSHTPAPQQICWHLGKDGSYPGWRPGKDCWLGLLTCKNRLPYNLYCVGGDVKHCTIQSSPGKDWPGSERVEWCVEVMLIALCLSTDRCIVMDG